MEKGEEIRTLTGHTDFILSVCFSPDDIILASGGGDYMRYFFQRGGGVSAHKTREIF